MEADVALSLADRQGRISPEEHDDARANLVEIWPDVDIVDLTAELATAAAGLARSLALRGDDAVHCASVAALNHPDMVAAAGYRDCSLHGDR